MGETPFAETLPVRRDHIDIIALTRSLPCTAWFRSDLQVGASMKSCNFCTDKWHLGDILLQ